MTITAVTPEAFLVETRSNVQCSSCERALAHVEVIDMVDGERFWVCGLCAQLAGLE